MRISQLESQDYLGTSGVGTNSYLILNYDTDAAPANPEEEADINPPVTCKVQMDELGKGLINDLNIVQYDDDRVLKTLTGGETAYSSTTIGYFMTSNDKNAIDSAVTDISYDGTNKKFTRAIRNGNAADVVTTAQLLTDMNLNITQITNTAGKTVATIDEANGKVSATFQDISITSSQISDKSDAINSSSSTVATSKAVKDALESLDITQITNTAGKTVATIDETDGKVSATFQDISITSAQISDSNAANKVLKLNASGLIDSTYLPSYVDDVIEGYFYNDAFYEEAAHTNAITGESGKIYVDLGGGRAIYRYSGSAFVEIPASPISDVQINGTSIINNSVANVPKANTNGDLGVVCIDSAYGIEINNQGRISTYKASDGYIKNATSQYLPIVPYNQHTSVFYGLAKAAGDSTQAASENAVGTYTADAQSAIRTMIGAGTYSKPSGGIPAADLADTYLTAESLFIEFLNNFDVALTMPSTVTWNVDENTNALTATLNEYTTSSTIVIQRQNGANWETYDGGARADAEHFRAYVTRNLTLGTKNYTNSAVVGTEYVEPMTRTLTINYLYTDNSTVTTSYTASIKEGKAYNVTSPTVQYFTADTPVVSGIVGSSNITVNVIYTRNTHDLTINYVYEDNSTAATTHTETVGEGLAYSVNSPTIQYFSPDTAVVSGTMSTFDITTTVTYTRNTHTLTINYIYEDESEAANAHTETVGEGLTYTVNSPTITDFTPDIAIVSGTMGSSNITTTVTYTANAV